MPWKIPALIAASACLMSCTQATEPDLGGTPGAVAPMRVTAVPGMPVLRLASYDLASLGYRADEYFVAGTAQSYRYATPPSSDGPWDVQPAATAPYVTRVVVVRPSDPAKFSGTAVLEWLNVTAGSDTTADWMMTHREIFRRGHAYVAVSAQRIGLEGGTSVTGNPAQGLKKLEPARYGTLSHPGDVFSYDIFSQAGQAVKAAATTGVLGPLRPRRVIAMGESQSAGYLTTYVNAVDPVARVFDGFFVHSRFGAGAALDGSRGAANAGPPPPTRFRRDLRVPVLSLITETDLIGGRLGGYLPARVPDGRNLRVWEVTGTAHADNYLLGPSIMDDGRMPLADLAKIFMPSTQTPAGPMPTPINTGIVHRYTVHAALAALDGWIRTGRAPASTAPLSVRPTPGGGPLRFELDANGIARGGVRTPWVDVPTMALSGVAASNSFLGSLVGSATPLDRATLARLYPGGKADYLARFTRSLDAAIRAGHVLAADRAEILAIADHNYPG